MAALTAIRLATAGDAPAVQAIYAPIVAATPISFEIEPPTAGEIAARITGLMPGYPWLVAEAGPGPEVAGYAYARPYQPRAAYRWSVETSLYVAEAARGAGVGRALYRSLLALLAAQGFRQAIAGSVIPNPASIALHESVGFVRIGVQRRIGWKLGAWHDVVWWQKELAAGDGPPAPSIPVDQLPAELLTAALQVDRRG